MRCSVLGSCLVVLCVLTVSSARAEDRSPVPVCPAGNLLAHKRPSAWQDVSRDLGLLTDEQVTPEGATWDSQPAVILDTAASTVTWDLGAVTAIRSVAIQADANDTYTVWGSLDGKSFKVYGQIDPVENHGLRTRTMNVNDMVARYLKFGEGVGDSAFSASEVAAYCQTPSPFPAAMKVVDAPIATVPPKKLLDHWNNDASVRWELLLACLGLLFLWWERKVERARKAAPQPAAHAGTLHRLRARVGQLFARPRVRNVILGVMGVLAFATYFNFGAFHFWGFIHGHDSFHYYIGSKYFNELGYERLYECVAIADSEEPSLRRRVELRKITNLYSNQVETTADILAHPERCKSHFTAQRWASFAQDLRYFRTLETPRRWDDAQLDHGFNATPVWNIMGTLLSNTGSASRMQVLILNSVDCLLVAFLALMIGWAFGWRVLAVALLVFATNHPGRWAWTGGSFLRWDWLFWMGASVCLAKMEHFFLAGMCLAYSTLLRIFPLFMFIAPLLALGYHYYRHRQLERRFLRFFMGAAVATAILLPVSVVTAGGIRAYPAFVHNTLKHQNTPLTNYVGLRTVVSYRPSEVGRLMVDNRLVDSWSRWKIARLKSFRQAKPLYFAVVLSCLVIVGLAVRKSHPWEAIALSSILIFFGVELTNYYYSFLIVVALLYAKREVAGRWLLGASAVTQFIAWAPIQGVPSWLSRVLPASMRDGLKNFGMPNGLDEQYTWMSVAILIAFAMIAWDMMVAREAALAPAVMGPRLAPASAAPAPALPEKPQAEEGSKEPNKEDRGGDGGPHPNLGRQRGRRKKRR